MKAALINVSGGFLVFHLFEQLLGTNTLLLIR